MPCLSLALIHSISISDSTISNAWNALYVFLSYARLQI